MNKEVRIYEVRTETKNFSPYDSFKVSETLFITAVRAAERLLPPGETILDMRLLATTRK